MGHHAVKMRTIHIIMFYILVSTFQIMSFLFSCFFLCIDLILETDNNLKKSMNPANIIHNSATILIRQKIIILPDQVLSQHLIWQNLTKIISKVGRGNFRHKFFGAGH